ncbi:hypothetical protein F1D05_09925 [Kribbella qitaiheensis]|uniref:Uncharacterized protein n=1 Tax=Kribbella qitaiheensis TaxID=1544730 RepID=A0A7G6WVY5_9ACTN|nr:hypothetical protein [Kribbella qitaiheensis]QNE18150.1 hypothetical protein F1D05_09925 [Kribbella qitaiheensis]
MTNLVHKYAELQYTIPAATVAMILRRADDDPSDQVMLFADEGGITATVTLQTGYGSAAQATSDAVALAGVELHRHTHHQGGIPAPWRVLIVDRDGMADHLTHPGCSTDPETLPPHDEGLAGSKA